MIFVESAKVRMQSSRQYRLYKQVSVRRGTNALPGHRIASRQTNNMASTSTYLSEYLIGMCLRISSRADFNVPHVI